MRVMNISEKRFKELVPLELPEDIYNMESDLYIIEEKTKWLKRKYILKKFCNDVDTVFSNKLYTINELIGKKDEIGIEELIMPEKLISVYGKIVGYTMPLIDNINFKHVLTSIKFSNEQKIAYFKEIGEILNKMKKVRQYTSITDFYLNDLHENNFILNKNTGRINVVDMDSCKINGNSTFISRYLFPFSPISDVSKYVQLEQIQSVGGVYKIDENTDLFCYIVMILNYLSGTKITSLSIDEYYDYLSYLHSIGVSYELIDMFALVYTGHDNVNPYEYLDELVNVVGRSSYKVYEYIKKK